MRWQRAYSLVQIPPQDAWSRADHWQEHHCCVLLRDHALRRSVHVEPALGACPRRLRGGEPDPGHRYPQDEEQPGRDALRVWLRAREFHG